MDATHLHLILTHFPIVGTFIAVGIFSFGLFTDNKSAKKIALIVFILMAILSIPVFLTGEEAEESIEHLPGISEQVIEAHEEFAEIAIWFMAALGVISLVDLLFLIKDFSFVKTWNILTLFISLITLGLFVKVGSLGGAIRHTEIRSDIFNNNENNNSDLYREKEHDDDD